MLHFSKGHWAEIQLDSMHVMMNVITCNKLPLDLKRVSLEISVEIESQMEIEH